MIIKDGYFKNIKDYEIMRKIKIEAKKLIDDEIKKIEVYPIDIDANFNANIFCEGYKYKLTGSLEKDGDDLEVKNLKIVESKANIKKEDIENLLEEISNHKDWIENDQERKYGDLNYNIKVYGANIDYDKIKEKYPDADDVSISDAFYLLASDYTNYLIELIEKKYGWEAGIAGRSNGWFYVNGPLKEIEELENEVYNLMNVDDEEWKNMSEYEIKETIKYYKYYKDKFNKILKNEEEIEKEVEMMLKNFEKEINSDEFWEKTFGPIKSNLERHKLSSEDLIPQKIYDLEMLKNRGFEFGSETEKNLVIWEIDGDGWLAEKLPNNQIKIIRQYYESFPQEKVLNSKEEDKEKDKEELKKGIKFEKEHKPTIDKIKEFYKANNDFPPNELIYEWIALDHINEFKKYYDEKVGLPNMEKNLKEIESNLKENINNAENSNDINENINKLRRLKELNDVVLNGYISNIKLEDVVKSINKLGKTSLTIKGSSIYNKNKDFICGGDEKECVKYLMKNYDYDEKFLNCLIKINAVSEYEERRNQKYKEREIELANEKARKEYEEYEKNKQNVKFIEKKSMKDNTLENILENKNIKYNFFELIGPDFVGTCVNGYLYKSPKTGKYCSVIEIVFGGLPDSFEVVDYFYEGAIDKNKMKEMAKTILQKEKKQ
jgi:hypothetical protein